LPSRFYNFTVEAIYIHVHFIFLSFTSLQIHCFTLFLISDILTTLFTIFSVQNQYLVPKLLRVVIYAYSDLVGFYFFSISLNHYESDY